jgi:hypothetical protein
LVVAQEKRRKGEREKRRRGTSEADKRTQENRSFYRE